MERANSVASQSLATWTTSHCRQFTGLSSSLSWHWFQKGCYRDQHRCWGQGQGQGQGQRKLVQYLISENHVGLKFAQIQLILTIDVQNIFAWTVLRFQNSQDQDQVNTGSLPVSGRFANASDRQRLAANSSAEVIVVVPANLPTFADLCQNAYEKLFDVITATVNNVLHLHPSGSVSRVSTPTTYGSVGPIHNFAFPSRTGHLTNNNFIYNACCILELVLGFVHCTCSFSTSISIRI